MGLGILVGGEQVLDAKITCEQLGPDSPEQSMPMVLVTSGAPLGKTVTVPSHLWKPLGMSVGLLCGCEGWPVGGGPVGHGKETVAVPPAVGQVKCFLITHGGGGPW